MRETAVVMSVFGRRDVGVLPSGGWMRIVLGYRLSRAMAQDRLVAHLPDGSTGWIVLWGSAQDVWADIKAGNCDEWLEVSSAAHQRNFVRRDAIIRVELYAEPVAEVEEFDRTRLAVHRPGDVES